MVVSNVRPFLLFVAGAGAGALIVWGIESRNQANPERGTPIAAISTAHGGGSQIGADDSDDSALANASGTPNPGPVNRMAIPKTLKAEPSRLQANGLPLGVVPNAVNMDVYKRLPGIQPPVVNYDGRDMSQEAEKAFNTTREPTVFPGTERFVAPGASVTPMPFPKTVEEANQGAGNYSPSPSPQP